MHRKNVISLLSQYYPKAVEEMQAKERMVAFINQYPDCFERSLDIGHITASAWLLNKAGTHVLLMHHVKLNRWLQPGGHCDGNPDPLVVALKEAQEESGIRAIAPVSPLIFDIDIHAIPARQTKNILNLPMSTLIYGFCFRSRATSHLSRTKSRMNCAG